MKYLILLTPILILGCDSNRQVPPADLKISYDTSAKVQCDNGSYVTLVPEARIATVNVNLVNPVLPKESFEHAKSLNLLGMNNRPYVEYSKYKTIDADGVVGVRTDLKEEFFPIGTIDSADLINLCKDSTLEGIKATCVRYNYKPGTPQFDYCINVFEKEYREGFLTNFTLHLRPEVKVALSRSQPTCHNKWMGLDPETARSYTTYVMFTEGSRTMEFALADGSTYSNGHACESVVDGWTTPKK